MKLNHGCLHSYRLLNNMFLNFIGQVDKHMREIEEKSALTIQRHWRAFRTRRNFHQQKQCLKQYKAAVLIQRAVSISTNHCQEKIYAGIV